MMGFLQRPHEILDYRFGFNLCVRAGHQLRAIFAVDESRNRSIEVNGEKSKDRPRRTPKEFGRKRVYPAGKRLILPCMLRRRRQLARHCGETVVRPAWFGIMAPGVRLRLRSGIYAAAMPQRCQIYTAKEPKGGGTRECAANRLLFTGLDTRDDDVPRIVVVVVVAFPTR